MYGIYPINGIYPLNGIYSINVLISNISVSKNYFIAILNIKLTYLRVILFRSFNFYVLANYRIKNFIKP